MGAFFRGWRVKVASATLVLLVILGVFVARQFLATDRPTQYLFHYHLSEAEIAVLPSDLARLASVIQDNMIDSIPRAELEDLAVRQ